MLQTQTERRVAEEQIATLAQKEQAEEARRNLVRATTLADREKDITEARQSIEIARLQAESVVEQARGRSLAAVELARGDAQAYNLRAAVIGSDSVSRLEMLRLVGENRINITPNILVGDMSPLVQSILRPLTNTE